MSKVYVTAIRLSDGGYLVKHITHVWYSASATYTDNDTKITTHDMAERIERGTDNAWVKDSQTYIEAQVLVVTPASGRKYLRTKADGDLGDNLLSLPRK